MTGRLEELRWALHRADWVVSAETESTRFDPGTWAIEHAFLPLSLTLEFDCMDGERVLQPVAQTYGCFVAGTRSLGVYLGGKRDSGQRNIDQFIVQLTEYAHQAQLLPEPHRELAVSLGHVRTQQQLFNTLVEALSFPDYFGNNWSAVDDCMRDLSWLSGPLLIRFTGMDRLQERNGVLHGALRERMAFWQDFWDNTVSQRVHFEG